MFASNSRSFVSVVVAALAALSLAGCAGHEDTDLDDDLEISETDSAAAALTSPDPSGGTDDDRTDGSKGDHADKGECREGDDHKGKHHLRHKFKILDGVDGARDKQITIATLPAGLPERLIAKLHTLDSDGDGTVTRAELKAALAAGKHGKRGKHGGKGN